MRIEATWALMGSVFFSAPLPAALAVTPDEIVGVWFGEDETQGPWTQWLITRASNGKLIVEFRDFPQCREAEVFTQYGIWMVQGDFMITRIDRVVYEENPEFVSEPVAYTYYLREVTADRMVYQVVPLGPVFTAYRVKDPKVFEFPPPRCELKT